MIGWLAGFGIGVLGLVLGLFAIRFLVRRRVSWWQPLLGPALSLGPALGLVLGPWIGTGDPSWSVFGEPKAVAANLGWSLVVFFGATSLFGFVRVLVSSSLFTEQLGIRIPTLLLDSLRYLVWIVMVFVVIGGIWHRTEWFSALFTASAVGTVIIGLALQETLVNFFAGVGIVNEGTYRIGDWIWVGEDEGEVISLSRRATQIRARTGDVLILPNRLVMTSKVRNESQASLAHAEFVYVQAPYDVPPNRVRAALKAACEEVPKILSDPAPILRTFRFADSGVEYQVKIFVKDIPGIPDIKSDLSAQVWYHFKRAGISIPYPIRELKRFEPSEAREDVATVVLETLAATPFFGSLPPEVVTALAKGGDLAIYGASERVVQQGAAGDSCYVVRSGRLGVFVTDGLAERQVATLAAGDLFGEMSLLTGEPRSATVRALEDSRLVRVGHAGLRAALERAPDLAQRLAETAALRREGLLEARAALDAQARERVRAATVTLGELIRRFFRLPEEPKKP